MSNHTPTAKETYDSGAPRPHTRVQIRLTPGERRKAYALAKSLNLNVSELFTLALEVMASSKGIAAAKVDPIRAAAAKLPKRAKKGA